MRKRDTLVFAIVANQENKEVKLGTFISQNKIKNIFIEVEKSFEIDMPKEYPEVLDVLGLIRIVSEQQRLHYLCEEIRWFGRRFYDFAPPFDKDVQTPQELSKMRRIASCYILKCRIGRKEKDRRDRVCKSKNLLEMAKAIIGV